MQQTNGSVAIQSLPSQTEFSLVADAFIAVLLGMVGAKDSVYLYHSQQETA